MVMDKGNINADINREVELHGEVSKRIEIRSLSKV